MFVILPNAFGNAATNMAIDAALLEALPEQATAFRHYGWTEPSVTFGYSQRYEEVAALHPSDVTLCRRMTGGGIVDHRNDWTYALVIEKSAPCAGISSTELYAKVHSSLAQALEQQDIQTKLAPCPRKCNETVPKATGPDQCFVQPVMNDVLTPDGAKIAGAAMKRTRKGLLIQGSVDRSTLPETLNYGSFSEEFTRRLANTLQLSIEQPEDLRPYFPKSIIAAEEQKFGGEDWTRRR